MPRSLFVLVLALGWLAVPGSAHAQMRSRAEPRPIFVTVTYDGLHTLPLHFKEFPLEQLVGEELDEVLGGEIDYRTADGATLVRVSEFRKRGRGAGVMVYPFGAPNGASLAVRASYEELPVISFEIEEGGAVEPYRLTDGRAFDVGAGLIVSDRSAGWGLGAHALLLGGLGQIRGELGRGRRYFAEAGGGLNVGPFGVQLAVKFAYNRLRDPRPHDFFTVPVTLRSTLSF